MVNYLQNKFKDNQRPVYYFNEFDTVTLDEDQASKCLVNSLLIDGSSKFQVHVFKHTVTCLSS